MDGIFDRLTNLIRSLVQEGYDEDGAADGKRFRDPDLQDAWEELDEYMSTGKDESEKTRAREGAESAGSRAHADSGSYRRSSDAWDDSVESLRQDYKNLEVPFNAPFEDVKRAYKRLLVAYHPDKHSADPKKLKIATEITKKVNYSFQRIKKYHDSMSR